MEIDKGTVGWIYKMAHKNLWRVSSIYDLDDLVQDGHLWYLMIVDRYCKRPRTRKHVMALFKTSFMRYLTDLANKRTRYESIEQAFSLYHTIDDGGDMLHGVSDNGAGVLDIEVAAVIAQAPEPVRKVIQALMTDDGAKRFRALDRYRLDGTREVTSERLARIAGIPECSDLLAKIRRYLERGETQNSRHRISNTRYRIIPTPV